MSINNLQQSEKTIFSLNIGKIAHNRLDQTSGSKLSPTSSLKRAENAISSTRSETIIRSCLQALLGLIEVMFLAKGVKQVNETILHYI